MMKRLMLIFFTVLASFVLNAQSSQLSKKISVSFSNNSIEQVLQKISTKEDVKFSYDPSILPKSKRITLKKNNISLGELLEIIFSNTDIKAQEIGSQIVLLKDLSKTQPVDIEKTISPEVMKHSPNEKSPDTVLIHKTDTLRYYFYDTITMYEKEIQKDTIITVDTVFIERLIRDTATKDSSVVKKGFFVEISPSFSVYKLSFPKNKSANSYFGIESLHNLNFAYGIDAAIGYKYMDFGMKLVGGLQNFSETNNFFTTTTSGGFYKSDTLETYYSIAGTDTTWFYITDSSWIPLETHNKKTNATSNINYFNIKALFSFDFVKRNNFLLYAILGGSVNIPISIKYNSENAIEQKTLNQLNKTLFLAHGGVGATQRISGNWSLFEEIKYTTNINQRFKQITFDERLKMVQFNIGLRFNK